MLVNNKLTTRLYNSNAIENLYYVGNSYLHKAITKLNLDSKEKHKVFKVAVE